MDLEKSLDAINPKVSEVARPPVAPSRFGWAGSVAVYCLLPTAWLGGGFGNRKLTATAAPAARKNAGTSS